MTLNGQIMPDDLLRASFEDLFEHGPCGYLLTQVDGTILRANETLLGWTGFDRNDLMGRRFQDLITVSGKLFYETHYFPLLRLQGSVMEAAFDVLRRDREPLPVLMNSTLRTDVDDHPDLIVSVMFDASMRRAYEHELIRSQQRAEQLAAIVRLSSDAIVGMSPEGIVETWNDGAATMFGYSERDIIGTDLRHILSLTGEDLEWTDLLIKLRAGRPVQVDMAGSGMNGERVDVSASFTPHRDFLGSVETISVIMLNIAELRAIQRLQQEFLAVTTHELRSPVTGIKGNAQLLKRRGAYNERSVTAIIGLAQRLEYLINDLLLASQIQADRLVLDLKEIDLTTMVRATVDFLDVSDSVIHVESPAEPLMATVDPMRLSQVITNILTNAVKYSPAGAAITVRITRDIREVHISVIDQGVGIPLAALPHLFERFYRNMDSVGSIQGLGLGLYISQRIVEAHGGRIDVVSEVGHGSTFTVSLLHR